MTLSITDSLMESTETHHQAIPVRPNEPYGPWLVSWIRDREVTRDQAITAMTLAEFVSAGARDESHKFWPHVRNWSNELCLFAEQAVALILKEEK